MDHSKKNIQSDQDGITLLITLLTVSVLLGISAALMNVTLKQYVFANIAYASEVAFQAANAALECVIYLDKSGGKPFDIGKGSTNVACMGVTTAISISGGTITSGAEQKISFSWGTPETCSKASVYKYSSNTLAPSISLPEVPSGTTCPVGGVCTVVISRGYNMGCGEVTAATNPKLVEREYTMMY